MTTTDETSLATTADTSAGYTSSGSTDSTGDASTGSETTGSETTGSESTGSETTGSVVACDGEAEWVRFFPSESPLEQVNEIAVDGAGNAVVIGDFLGEVDFGSGKLVSEEHRTMYLAAFGPDGESLWSRRFAVAMGPELGGVQFDGAGDIVIHGRFWGELDLGGETLLDDPGTGSTAFLAKFTGDGEHVWSKAFGTTAQTVSHDVAIAPDDDIVLAVVAGGAINFGGGPLGDNKSRTFVARLDADGEHVWSRMLTHGGGESFPRVATDREGAVLVAGRHGYVGDFIGGPTVDDAEPRGYVLKLTPEGEFAWLNKPTGFGSLHIAGLATDLEGRVHLGGTLGNEVTFGGPMLVSAGQFDVFAATLDRDGQHLWSARYGVGGDDHEQQSLGLVTNPIGDSAQSGPFAGMIDFGGGPLVNENGDEGYDSFVAKLGPGGEHRWSREIGGTGHQPIAVTAIDAAGYVWAAGTSWGPLVIAGQEFESAHMNYDTFLVKYCP